MQSDHNDALEGHRTMKNIRKAIIALLTIAFAGGLAAAPASAHHDGGGDYPPLAFRIDVVGANAGSLDQTWLLEQSEGVNEFDPAEMGHNWDLEVESNAHTRSVAVTVRGVARPIQNLSGNAFTFNLRDSGGFIHGGTYEITTQGFSGFNGTGEAGPVKRFTIKVAYPVVIVDGIDLFEDDPFDIKPEPEPVIEIPWWWTWTF